MPKFSASISFDFATNITKVGRQITKAFKGISKAAKGMTAAIAGNEKGFAQLSQIIKRGMLVGLAALAVAFGIAIVKAQEYESALLQLSAITGITGKALDDFGDIALSSSIRFGVGANNYLEAVQLVASAKPALLQQPKLLRKITDEAGVLAKASGIDLARSAVSLTDAMNQFELGANDASRAINVLAAGSKYGASLVGDSAAALVKAGVAATIAKSSFEETNAAIQVLALRGIKGALAGTQLRGVYLKLNKVIEDTAGINNATEALDALSNANLSGSKLTQLFGLENISAAKILIDSRKQVKAMTKDITGTTVAYEQAAIVQASFGERMKRVKQGIVVALMVGFRPLIQVLSHIFDIGGRVLSVLVRYPKIISGILVAAAALVGLLGLLAIEIGIFTLIATGAGGALVAAASAMWAFNVALFANPIGLIVLAVVALIAGITILAVKFEKFRKALFLLIVLTNPLALAALLIVKNWEKVKAFFGGFVDGFRSSMLPVLEEFKEVWDAIAEPVEAAIDVFAELFDMLFPGAKASAKELATLANVGRMVGQFVAFGFKLMLIPLRLVIQAFMFLVDIGKLLGTAFTEGIGVALRQLNILKDRGMKIIAPFVDAFKFLKQKIVGETPPTPTGAATAAGAATVQAQTEAAKVLAQQNLEVNMRIKGPGQVESVKSSGNLKFTAQTGMMIPGAT